MNLEWIVKDANGKTNGWKMNKGASDIFENNSYGIW